MSSAPFFSTTGTENWLAEEPRPPAPGLSATTFLRVQTVCEGSWEGTESVYAILIGHVSLEPSSKMWNRVHVTYRRPYHGLLGLLSIVMYSLSLKECVSTVPVVGSKLVAAMAARRPGVHVAPLSSDL